MKVLVISDTHGRPDNFRIVSAREEPYDLLIHCGDLEGDEELIRRISGCPCFMVAGNNDFFSSLPPEQEFQILDKKALLTHGHHYYVYMDTAHLYREAMLRRAELVFFGHTHKPLIQEENGILLINPGSLSYPRQEGRLPSYITMEIRQGDAPRLELKYLEQRRR